MLVLVGEIDSHFEHISLIATCADNGIPVLYTQKSEVPEGEGAVGRLIGERFEVTRFLLRLGISICFAVPRHGPEVWVQHHRKRIERRFERRLRKLDANPAGTKAASAIGNSWDWRLNIIAQWVPKHLSIADVGCGDMGAEKVLHPRAYLPIDRISRDARTRVLDLNASEIPTEWLADVELVLFLGVLEYVDEPRKVLAQVSSPSRRMAVSYKVVESRSRTVGTFRSALSDNDLRQAFRAFRYDVEEFIETRRQSIYLIKPEDAPPLNAKRLPQLPM